MRPRVSAIAFLFLLSLFAPITEEGLLAQIQADTSLVKIDSLATDSTNQRIKLSWKEVLKPALGDSADLLVSNTRAKEFIERFDNQNGYFRLQQGGFGLPTFLSPFGLPPGSSRLLLDGLPIEDPLTGQIDWDFAPIHYATSSASASSGAGYVSSFETRSKLFSNALPYTELKYFSGSNGLQAVSAIHSQNRQVRFFGSEFMLNTSLRYRGGAASGEYTNANYRHREIGTSILLSSPQWYWKLDLSSGNHRNGVHGGVVFNTGEVYDDIYTRFGANVNSSSEKRTKKRSHIRSDLGLKWANDKEPLVATLFWQSNLNRFFADTTVAVHTQRVGLMLEQDFMVGAHLFESTFSYWNDRAGAQSSWGELGSEMELVISDRFEWLGNSFLGRLALGKKRGENIDAASIFLERKMGNLGFLIDLRSSKTIPHYLYQVGFSPFTDGEWSVTGFKTGRTSLSRLGVNMTTGSLYFGLEGFFSKSSNSPFPTERFGFNNLEGDSRSGLVGKLSWREKTKRGLSGSTKLTLYSDYSEEEQVLNNTSLSLDWRFEASLGARYSLFSRELILHSYLEFDFYALTRPSLIQNSTGLMTVDAFGSIDSNTALLDFWTDAKIRGATIFIGVENILSPWLEPGSSQIWSYPLHDLALRVGLLWPING